MLKSQCDVRLIVTNLVTSTNEQKVVLKTDSRQSHRLCARGLKTHKREVGFDKACRSCETHAVIAIACTPSNWVCCAIYW